MRIVVPRAVREALQVAVARADNRETGGVLMGERKSEEVYQVVGLTTQANGGTVASFFRRVAAIGAPLDEFFERTGHNYIQHNYLGEWHSHPAFSLSPSTTDNETMWDIVDDPRTGALFAVLLLVRLDNEELITKPYVYGPGPMVTPAEIVHEEDGSIVP